MLDYRNVQIVEITNSDSFSIIKPYPTLDITYSGQTYPFIIINFVNENYVELTTEINFYCTLLDQFDVVRLSYSLDGLNYTSFIDYTLSSGTLTSDGLYKYCLTLDENIQCKFLKLAFDRSDALRITKIELFEDDINIEDKYNDYFKQYSITNDMPINPTILENTNLGKLVNEFITVISKEKENTEIIDNIDVDPSYPNPN
jgi:hypothetical protein